MQTIDPTTNEIIFTVGTDEVSLTELLGIDINLESDFPDLSFRIKNLDETNTLLVKSRFKNWKGYPVTPGDFIKIKHKNANKVRLSAQEGEIEVRILFI